jgi:hypothetical protein
MACNGKGNSSGSKDSTTTARDSMHQPPQ